jgi:hypothetical protein
MVKTKSYKPINVSVGDWSDYDEMAKYLTKELNFPVSIPNVIRQAVTYFKDNNYGKGA